jgi:hypothetical protein
METSAKSSQNVGEAFISMTNDIIKNIQTKEISQPKEKIDINPKAKDISNKKNCC